MARPDQLKDGLQELPHDERDFSRVAVFGAIAPKDLPTGDFLVSMALNVRDQGESDECTAFATVAASEDQEAVILDPHFTFYATKILLLSDPESWGADLRSACRSHVKHGALEEEYAPFAANVQREMVLDPDNWTEDHRALAYEHRKNSFFDVLKGSPYDTFDTVRGALWQNRSKMQSIVTGARWRPSWTDAPGGVIEDRDYSGEGGTAHAFVLKGQRIFNGVPHLVAQLSNGDEIGDKGIFYMPRGVANKELVFGCFSFEDMPRSVAENHLYFGTQVDDSRICRWWKIFSRIIIDNIRRV